MRLYFYVNTKVKDNLDCNNMCIYTHYIRLCNQSFCGTQKGTLNVNFEAMKNKIEGVLLKYEYNKITIEEAKQELLNLHSVSGCLICIFKLSFEIIGSIVHPKFFKY